MSYIGTNVRSAYKDIKNTIWEQEQGKNRDKQMHFIVRVRG